MKALASHCAKASYCGFRAQAGSLTPTDSANLRKSLRLRNPFSLGSNRRKDRRRWVRKRPTRANDCRMVIAAVSYRSAVARRLVSLSVGSLRAIFALITKLHAKSYANAGCFTDFRAFAAVPMIRAREAHASRCQNRYDRYARHPIAPSSVLGSLSYPAGDVDFHECCRKSTSSILGDEPNSMRCSRDTIARGGYTLLELVVASAGATFLIVGLASSVYIASQAVDPSSSPGNATIQGDSALSDLMADLRLATSFSETTPTAITFSVPDRDNDTNPETIRYAWSGTPGDPLTRQYNGGAAAVVVENVHDFSLDLPAPAPNLLSNPGIESGMTGWEAIPGATAQTQNNPVYAGSLTLYAWRNTGNDESGARQNVTALLTNGTAYEIGAWMRKWAAPAPFDVQIQLRVISTGGGEQVFATNPVNIDNVAYKWVGGTVTPTWSGTLLMAYWEATGISKIQDLYVDNAILRLHQQQEQNLNIVIQVGGDSRARIEAGLLLLNSPL